MSWVLGIAVYVAVCVLLAKMMASGSPDRDLHPGEGPGVQVEALPDGHLAGRQPQLN